MREPKYKVGEPLYILTEWEGCYGAVFTPILIKKLKSGSYMYFDASPEWHGTDFYDGVFDGWWEESLLSNEFPGYGDS